METEKVDKAKEETHFSGAYIQSLVESLTSTNDPIDGDGDGDGEHNNNNNTQIQQPPPQAKKQVRRRLHSSKPYQERLLNMAEARSEIATALKFHRASMKQQEAANANANANAQPQSSQQQGNSNSPTRYPSTPTPTTTPTTTTTATYNYNYYSALSFPHHCHWPISPIVPPPPPLHHQNLNLPLPNQTLGLNLNFQDFNNLKTSIYHTPMSSSASSSPKEVVVANSSGEGLGVAGGDVVIGGLHLHDAMEMEWNNNTSLKTIEIGAEEKGGCDEDVHHPFEQIMEFPPWLINANESSCCFFSDEYSPDPALPCMDIGEIEGMDGEWLA